MDEVAQLVTMETTIGRPFNHRLLGFSSLNADGSWRHYGPQIHNLRKNNDLAIIGDIALSMVLSTLWFRSRDQGGRSLDKGHWSTLQRDLVSDSELAARGVRFGLDVCIIRNAGTTVVSTRMMATAVEAIIGAVFEDSGRDLEAVRAVMDRLDFFAHPLLANTDCTVINIAAEPAVEI